MTKKTNKFKKWWSEWYFVVILVLIIIGVCAAVILTIALAPTYWVTTFLPFFAQ